MLLTHSARRLLGQAAAAFLATTVGALGEALAALPGLLAPPPGPAEPMVRCSLTVVGDTVRLRLLTTADGAAGGEEEGGGEGAGPGKEDGRLAQTLAQAAVLLATAVIALLVLRRAPGRRKAF